MLGRHTQRAPPPLSSLSKSEAAARAPSTRPPPGAARASSTCARGSAMDLAGSGGRAGRSEGRAAGRTDVCRDSLVLLLLVFEGGARLFSDARRAHKAGSEWCAHLVDTSGAMRVNCRGRRPGRTRAQRRTGGRKGGNGGLMFFAFARPLFVVALALRAVNALCMELCEGRLGMVEKGGRVRLWVHADRKRGLCHTEGEVWQRRVTSEEQTQDASPPHYAHCRSASLSSRTRKPYSPLLGTRIHDRQSEDANTPSEHTRP